MSHQRNSGAGPDRGQLHDQRNHDTDAGGVAIPRLDSRLPFIVKAVICGIIIGMGLLIAGLYFEAEAKPPLLVEISERLGEAVLIATVVGLGLDRLFHYDHVGTLTDAMSGALQKGFDSSKEQMSNQIERLIPQVLMRTAGGHRLEVLDDDRRIYDVLIAYLDQYPCFTNTIIDISPTVISDGRRRYYEHKAQLIATGRLTCRELVSENSKPIIDDIYQRLSRERRDRLFVRVVDLGKTLSSVINFCIFQQDFSRYDGAVLMVGWFSQGDFGYEHRCIMTEHPELVRMFGDYFQIQANRAVAYTPRPPSTAPPAPVDVP